MAKSEWGCFGIFPNDVAGQDALVELLRARGADIEIYVPEYVTEAVLTFHYQGHEFRGDTVSGGSWSFEAPSGCPKEVLENIYSLLAGFLGTYDFSRRF